MIGYTEINRKDVAVGDVLIFSETDDHRLTLGVEYKVVTVEGSRPFVIGDNKLDVVVCSYEVYKAYRKVSETTQENRIKALEEQVAELTRKLKFVKDSL